MTLITDPIAHFVTDVDADLEWNQPSGVESIEIHVPLTSKYGSRVELTTYTAIFGLHHYMIKKSDYWSYWLPKQRSTFVCFANLVVDARHAMDGTGDTDWEKQNRWCNCSWNAGRRCVQLCDHCPGNTLSLWTIFCLWRKSTVTWRFL